MSFFGSSLSDIHLIMFLLLSFWSQPRGLLYPDTESDSPHIARPCYIHHSLTSIECSLAGFKVATGLEVADLSACILPVAISAWT